MTSKQALFNMDQCGIEKIGLMVEFQHVILKDLIKLEKIAGYINADDIPDNLKLEIIKNILNEIKGKE